MLHEQRATVATETCRVRKWLDGDTVIAECPSTGRKGRHLRLHGIDTAETGADDNAMKRGRQQARMWGRVPVEQVIECGQRASEYVRQSYPAGIGLTVQFLGRDSYDRDLVRLYRGTEYINAKLYDEGLAACYPFPRPALEAPRLCRQTIFTASGLSKPGSGVKAKPARTPADSRR